MYHLPTELLEQIFANLSRDELLPLRQVCFRFRNIITSCTALRSKFELTLNWRHLRESKHGGPPPAAKVHFALAELVQVFWWWPQFGQTIVSLSLESCEFTLDILRHTKNLRELQLKHVKLSGRFVGDFKLEKLQSLSLSSANVEIFEALGRIITKSLAKIEFDFYKVAVETQLKAIEFVEARQDKLEDLSLIPVRYIERRVLQLTKPNLKRLSIRECENFDEEQLLTFFRAHTNLEDLSLERVRVSEQMISGLGQALPKLKRLELKASSSETFSVRTLPKHLKYLHLVGKSVDFTDCNFSALTELHIRCISVTGLNLLPQLTPKLLDLTVECCRFDSYSQLISTTVSLKFLQNLRLECVRWNVDDGFNGEPSLNLRRLYVKCSPTMSGRAVGNLFRMYPNLTEVKFYFMSCVDDAVIEELCRTRGQLATLALMSCSTSWESARHVGQYCKMLKYLEVRESWKVGKDELDQFRTSMEARGCKVVIINRSSD